MTLPTPTTVGELMKQLPFFLDEELAEDITSLDFDCQVGKDCAEVLKRASALIEVAYDVRGQIAAATLRQMNVFYYG
ncbi:hypothetical protein B447_14959 [Thauera sp. 27]|uniref:hypothetical protein n=1 Tax=Thauera sp. 27 TaxID=305700 RepID=UPI0002CF193A|nr:hypothetical protein [Thauera sp. 27]ENO78023.1 hypothetical protein B447_14959 [Thauera sp. 27]